MFEAIAPSSLPYLSCIIFLNSIQRDSTRYTFLNTNLQKALVDSHNTAGSQTGQDNELTEIIAPSSSKKAASKKRS